MSQIQITCRTLSSVPYKDLVIIQGDLKTLTEEGYQKLRQEIIDNGFSFAIHVWQDPEGKFCVLDGTQRLRVIKTMVEQEGWECPELPVVFVEAPDIKSAVKKLLGGASQYGTPDQEGLYELMTRFELGPLDIQSKSLTGIELPEFVAGYFEEEVVEIGPEEKPPKHCPHCNGLL